MSLSNAYTKEPPRFAQAAIIGDIEPASVAMHLLRPSKSKRCEILISVLSTQRPTSDKSGWLVIRNRPARFVLCLRIIIILGEYGETRTYRRIRDSIRAGQHIRWLAPS